MTPTNSVILAYSIVTLLLWGYATILFLQLKKQKANDSPS